MPSAMPSRLVLASALAAVLVTLAAVPASAQALRPAGDVLGAEPAARRASLPDGFYTETVASGFVVPVGGAFTPDGRLLVVEKEGRLSVVQSGQRRVALDLTGEVLEHGDRGLLGVAVDPGFAQTGWIFLAYTVADDGREGERTDAFGRVTRYTLAPDGTVDAASRRVLVGADFASGIPTCYSSHSVGTLAFGRDGTLFVGSGDGASYNTTDTGGLYPDCFGAGRFPASEDVGAFRSQLVTSLAGKILRIDPATGRGLASNPFWTGNPDDNASKVWALGFRNPFRFSVDVASGSADPAAGNPGMIVYGDVGWVGWEEVGVVRRGQNAGWPCREGAAAQSAGSSYPNTARGRLVCPGLAAVPPTFQWSHGAPAQSTPPGRTGLAVVAGAVYRGTRYPAAYRGRVFYADYVRAWLASARVASDGSLSDDALFSPNIGQIADVVYDALTENLYLVNIAQGEVVRLRHTSGDVNSPPLAVAAATPTQGRAPLAVQFTGAESADPDGEAVSFAWTFGTGETSTAANPSFRYTSPGDYTARLTVTDARGATATAAVAVTVRAGGPPSAAITQPTAGQPVLSGQTITLAGTGSDPDAGQTATLRYAWAVTLVHDGHQHPGAFAATGAVAQYAVPFHGDAGESYALLVRLTVTDASGLEATAERTVAIGEAGGEVDITDAGTAVALVPNPTASGGSQTLATIHDGVAPPPTSGAPTAALSALQYDSFTGDAARAVDWVGYTFAQPRRIGRVRFAEGLQFNDGGWFETLGVELLRGGQWVPAEGVVAAPAYGGADGRHFDAVDLSFAPTEADGVRIVGRPGGTSRFVSVSELRVFASASDLLGPLPAEWTTADIGPVYGTGSAGFEAGTFTVRGGGDLWGTLDHFRYVWQTLDGDGTVTARLVGLAGANPWAKAGLMIRAGTAGDAPHAMLVATPGHGVHLQYRAAAGGPTDWQPGPARTIPTWLRLQRTGRVVSASVSADGASWALVGSATVDVDGPALVGLVSTSTDFAGRNDVATATFTDVAVARPASTGPEADVTGEGTPIASVVAPTGGGSRDLGVIRDGIAPAPTTTFPATLTVQYDTYSAGPAREADYVGYAFAAPRSVSRLRFTEGAHNTDGGWFETLSVFAFNGTAWTLVPGLTVSPAYAGVNDGRHFDTYDLAFPAVVASGVIVRGRAGGAARFVSCAELRVFGPAGPADLPDGWTSADIGRVGAAGSAAYADGVFTVRGNGDLWGDADHFQYAYQTLAGDGSVTARLVSVAGENPWAKAGVMIRAGAGASAPHAMLVGTPGRGVHLQFRTAEGGETGWQAGDDRQRAPVWLRLQRTGDVFSASASADGVSWAEVGQTTVAMPPDVQVGLVSTSTDFEGRADLATAVFADVAIGGPTVIGPPAQSRAQVETPFEIASVFPNPAREAATVRVGLSAPGTVRVELVDVLGRRVFAASLREDAPGIRDLAIDLRGRSAGVYVVRVFQEGGAVETRRLTVVR